MDITDVRLENLRSVLRDQCGNNKTELARLLGMKSSEYVSRWFSSHKQHRRNIGSKTARKVEKAFRYESGWMDIRHVVVAETTEARDSATPPSGLGVSEGVAPDYGENSLSNAQNETIASLLDRLHARLQVADESVHKEVAGLMVSYLDNPAAGARIAKAIEALLGEEDPVDPLNR